MKYHKDILVYIPTYFDLRAVSNAVYRNRKLGLRTLLGIGRFNGFEDLGYDNMTVDFCEQNDIECFYHNPMYEEEILTKAFNFTEKLGYKVMLLLGSDCWLEGNVDEFYENLKDKITHDKADIFKLVTEEHKPDEKYQQKQTFQPMVYYLPWKLEAKHNHWLIYRLNDKFVLKPKGIVQGLQLHHDTSLRSKSRNKLMEKFQDWNVKRESEIFQKNVRGYKLF